MNGNIFSEGGIGQEIKITHKIKTAEIAFNKVPKIKNEVIRLDASPKIPVFFGIEPDTKQPIYTKRVDSKGSFKEEITGVITEKHEIRVFTSQMTKICSIKPPE